MVDWVKMDGTYDATPPVNELDIDTGGQPHGFIRVGGRHTER